MRGRTYAWTDAEQSLREWTTLMRAEFALKQRIERQRWEREVLAPAQEQIVAAIQAGQQPKLELPESV